MRRQEDFLIVGAGLALGLDVDESKLAGIGSAAQIRHRHDVRVHPARSRRLRSQAIPQVPVRRHHQALFLGGAIDVGRNDLAVPMDQLRRVRVVEQIHGHRHAFAHPDQRTRNAAVIPERADGVVLGDIDQHRTDPQRDVGLTGIRSGCRFGRGPIAASQQQAHSREPGNEIAACVWCCVSHKESPALLLSRPALYLPTVLRESFHIGETIHENAHLHMDICHWSDAGSCRRAARSSLPGLQKKLKAKQEKRRPRHPGSIGRRRPSPTGRSCSTPASSIRSG